MYVSFFKRFFDIVFSILLTTVLLPLFAVLALAVLIVQGRPIFFIQSRPGKNCKSFKLVKFRSMSMNTEKSDAERTNAFGRFLRSTHLDELPELYNIFVGEMSFVGPRPQLEEDMLFFSEEILKRQSVTPGLTGLAQSKGAAALIWEKKFEYDLEYIKKITFFGDMKIIAATAATVLLRRCDDNSPCGDYGQWLVKCGRLTANEYENILKNGRTARCENDNVSKRGEE